MHLHTEVLQLPCSSTKNKATKKNFSKNISHIITSDFKNKNNLNKWQVYFKVLVTHPCYLYFSISAVFSSMRNISILSAAMVEATCQMSCVHSFPDLHHNYVTLAWFPIPMSSVHPLCLYTLSNIHFYMKYCWPCVVAVTHSSPKHCSIIAVTKLVTAFMQYRNCFLICSLSFYVGLAQFCMSVEIRFHHWAITSRTTKKQVLKIIN